MNTNRGFIRLIILIALLLIALGYFGVNVKDVLASPVVRENLAYGWDLWMRLWTGYLREPFMWVYENVLKLLWELIKSALTGNG